MRPFEGLFGAAEVPAAIEAEHSCASQFTTLLSKLRVHRKWQFTTLLSEARPEKGPFIGKSSSRLYCRRPAVDGRLIADRQRDHDARRIANRGRSVFPEPRLDRIANRLPQTLHRVTEPPLIQPLRHLPGAAHAALRPQSLLEKPQFGIEAIGIHQAVQPTQPHLKTPTLSGSGLLGGLQGQCIKALPVPATPPAQLKVPRHDHRLSARPSSGGFDFEAKAQSVVTPLRQGCDHPLERQQLTFKGGIERLGESVTGTQIGAAKADQRRTGDDQHPGQSPGGSAAAPREPPRPHRPGHPTPQPQPKADGAASNGQGLILQIGLLQLQPHPRDPACPSRPSEQDETTGGRSGFPCRGGLRSHRRSVGSPSPVDMTPFPT